MLQNYQKTFPPSELVTWLQFKLLINLMFEPSLQTTSIATTHPFSKASTTFQPFSVCKVFTSSQSSTVRGVMFTSRV